MFSSNRGIISNKSIQYYQNIKNIKIKKEHLKKNTKLKQNDFEKLITLLSVENSKIILKEKVLIFSIHNKWLATIIIQLIILYENSTVLYPLGDFIFFFDQVFSIMIDRLSNFLLCSTKRINEEKELNTINLFKMKMKIIKKKKGKNKSHKKEFFLYITHKSKQKKEEHHENEKKNEIEKSNSINKNIKEIEINKEKYLLTLNSSIADNSIVAINEEYSINNYNKNKILYINYYQYNSFYNLYIQFKFFLLIYY